MSLKLSPSMTVEQYFDLEEASDIRQEFIDGERLPMSGGAEHHAIIMANINGALWYRLRGKNCLRSSYVYPDLGIVRGEPITADRATNLLNPTLVAEVSSPSTVSRGCGQKRALYHSIPALQLCLLVDQGAAHVEVDSRQDERWTTPAYTSLDAVIPLPALGCELPLAEVYANIAR